MQPLFYLYQDGIEKGPYTARGIRSMDIRPGTILSSALHRQEHFPYTEGKIDFDDPEEDSRLYFLAKEGNSFASMTYAQLREDLPQLRKAEFIWTQGMDQWKEIDAFPELKSLFKPTDIFPPIPHKPPVALPPLPAYTSGRYTSGTYNSYNSYSSGPGSPGDASVKSMWDYFWQCISKKYAAFEGRAGRKEYWSFVLFSFIIGAVVSAISGPSFMWYITDPIYSFDALSFSSSLSMLISLALLIPSLAVGVRRLHDTNRSGWWLLIGLIPVAGAIALLVFFIQEGTIGPNQYGADTQIRR